MLAKLSWPGSASHGVLVSAHFDSAWDSVGASDDLVQVATVLEFARALIAGPPLPVSVIFVLNGGEETMLQVRMRVLCTGVSPLSFSPPPSSTKRLEGLRAVSGE